MTGSSDVLALVRSSGDLVGAQRREDWFAIFSPDLQIEDPVGWVPVAADRIGRFWDAFIAGNDIRFEVHRDWVDGLEMVRDVTITTTLGTGAQVRTPAILHYTCVETDQGLRVHRMAAYWQPAAAFTQLLRPRRAALLALAGMSMRMLRHVGLFATVRFGAASRIALGRTPRAELAGHGVINLRKCVVTRTRLAALGTRDGAEVAVIRTHAGLHVFDRSVA